MAKRLSRSQERSEPLTGAEAFRVDLYFWLQALTAALVGLILVFTFVGRVIGVEGNSMLPTLHNGDTMLLQSLGYTPRQGDIVVLSKYFESVRNPIVKRVIATGGQTVVIDYTAGTVTVDGVTLDEPYIKETMRQPMFGGAVSVAVPEGRVFVMGDNRNDSLDSRYPALGTVDRRYVLGRVRMVLAPMDHFKWMSRGE